MIALAISLLLIALVCVFVGAAKEPICMYWIGLAWICIILACVLAIPYFWSNT